MLEILKGISIVDPWPVLYVEELGLLVIADLHLGLEESLRKEGLFLPAGTSRRASDVAREATMASGPRRVLLLGDIKHEFGFPSPSEWLEVKALLHWFVRRGLGVEVVRGNHDNYLVAILRKFGI
ncbi:MAG: metallophosphoesterase, partial [Candidatus Geothermarchaeales archaeon]